MKAEQRLLNKRSSETIHGFHITLADATSSLEEISLKTNRISRQRFENNVNFVVVLMTHTALAYHFHNQNHKYDDRSTRPGPRNNRFLRQKYYIHNRFNYEPKALPYKLLYYKDGNTQDQNSFFSEKPSDLGFCDLNPALSEDNPTSIGSIHHAQQL